MASIAAGRRCVGQRYSARRIEEDHAAFRTWMIKVTRRLWLRPIATRTSWQTDREYPVARQRGDLLSPAPPAHDKCDKDKIQRLPEYVPSGRISGRDGP